MLELSTLIFNNIDFIRFVKKPSEKMVNLLEIINKNKS